jgi:Tannase-like family of unknown function (DUF6351)
MNQFHQPTKPLWRGHAVVTLPLALCSAVVLLNACGGGSSDPAPTTTVSPVVVPTSAPVVSVKSSLPYRASGGSALIEVVMPADAKAGETLSVTVNGVDATAVFKDGLTAGTKIGLVTGLKDGDNAIGAKVGGSATTALTVTNYPIAGPISSGPYMTPFICQTNTLALPDGTKLVANATDPNCSAQTNVQYQYRTTGEVFKTLTDTKTIPSDVKMIKNAAGTMVPYIVRVETATIDRGIAQITMLFDPTKDVEPTPTTQPKNWNKRLVYGHGTGCVAGWYIQGGVFGYSPMNDTWLSRGYAVANNTLNHPTNACNNVLAGEAAAMTKEYFIKRYGAPVYTITTGTSGGAIASLQLSDMFPGLFDGALIDAVFPDVITIAQSGADAHLLSNYFATSLPSATSFTPAQKAAVSGYAAEITMVANGNQMGRIDPVPGRTAPTFPGVADYASAVWNPVVPVSLRYDPKASPPNFTGARPTIFDGGVNVYGRGPNPLDPSGKSTIGLRPYDNVGVQYGLSALNSGAITVSQFLDLNANVGGFDTDANPVTARTVGNADAILRANQSGLLLNGGGGLASMPIFGINARVENTNNYHMMWEHFAARERVSQANGNADNWIMWRGGPGTAPTAASPLGSIVALDNASIAAFEKWMEAIAADKSSDPQRTKVLRNKPADLTDGCFDTSSPPQFIAEKQVLGTTGTQCNILWPSYRFPRMEAGGPLASNNLKCQLKPVDLADYKVPFSAADLSRLRAIFPSGVCDFSKPGVNFAKVVPWASFGPSKVNLVFDITK